MKIELDLRASIVFVVNKVLIAGRLSFNTYLCVRDFWFPRPSGDRPDVALTPNESMKDSPSIMGSTKALFTE